MSRGIRRGASPLSFVLGYSNYVAQRGVNIIKAVKYVKGGYLEMKTGVTEKDLYSLVESINTMKGLKCDEVGAFVLCKSDKEYLICEINKATDDIVLDDVAIIDASKSLEKLMDFLIGYYLALVDVLGKNKALSPHIRRKYINA